MTTKINCLGGQIIQIEDDQDLEVIMFSLLGLSPKRTEYEIFSAKVNKHQFLNILKLYDYK